MIKHRFAQLIIAILIATLAIPHIAFAAEPLKHIPAVESDSFILIIFTTPDPYGSIHAGNMQFGDSPTLRNDRYMPSVHAILQSSNLYLFTMHNPVMFIDPTGEWAQIAQAAMNKLKKASQNPTVQSGKNHVVAFCQRQWQLFKNDMRAMGRDITNAGRWISRQYNSAIDFLNYGQRMGNHTNSALRNASTSAYRAASNINNFTVSNKHLQGAGGRYAKFTTDSQATVNRWVQDALRSDGAMFRSDNNADRIQVFVDMGREIGTRGEHIIKIVIDISGNIITTYPVHW